MVDIVASGTICDSTGCIGGAGGGEGYKPLAANSGRTEQARYIITSSGITFETHYSNSFQTVNPMLYEEWPSGVSEIIFEVYVAEGSFCVGGEGDLNLIGTSTEAGCTYFRYRGSSLSAASGAFYRSWIRLSINGNELVSCPDEVARTYVSGYPGLAKVVFSTAFCKYSKANGDWTGEITELKVEEAYFASHDTRRRTWKIWYK